MSLRRLGPSVTAGAPDSPGGDKRGKMGVARIIYHSTGLLPGSTEVFVAIVGDVA